MIYINTYRNIIIWYHISTQPAAVHPAPVHSKGEARMPDCSLKHLIAGEKKERKYILSAKNIYRSIFVFQEQRWRCLQMWKSEETNIPRKLKMLLGVVQSTLYQVQGTLYQVLGTGWTGVAKHSKAQVPKILLGAIPHSTSWLDISHLQSVL